MGFDIRYRRTCTLALLLILVCAVATTAAQQEVANGAPVEVVVPVPPVPVEGTDNQTHLVYELQVTNFAPVAETLTRLGIYSDVSPDVAIADFSEADLANLITHPGVEPTPKDKHVLPGGSRMIVYIWLTLKREEVVPHKILQKLYFSAPDSETGKIGQAVMAAPPVYVSKSKPLVLSPPLRGGAWIAANGPSNSSRHRRSAFPYYGTATIAERYAYDFVKLGEDGMAYEGDKKNNANWTGFGSEVLAVADGIVVEVQDGIPENVPFSPDRPVVITPQTSGGNFVTVDIGSRHFAYFAHMQPKSIRVKLGDHVRRGQVLGLLGNTGNSTNAHLHFHVSTGKRPGEGEGVPIIFSTFHLLGHADFIAAVGLIARPVGWRSTSIGKNGERRNEMPLENDVLKFP